MKTWFLIMYFWNVDGATRDSVGGSSFSIVETYSKEGCEQLGKASHEFLSIKRRSDFYASWPDWKCVEIQKAPYIGFDIVERQRAIKENQDYLNKLREQLK